MKGTDQYNVDMFELKLGNWLIKCGHKFKNPQFMSIISIFCPAYCVQGSKQKYLRFIFL